MKTMARLLLSWSLDWRARKLALDAAVTREHLGDAEYSLLHEGGYKERHTQVALTRDIVELRARLSAIRAEQEAVANQRVTQKMS
jgi:hypothetical protein